jgi:tight adherence protein C
MLIASSLALLAMAFGLVGAGIFKRLARRARSSRAVDRALSTREARRASGAAEVPDAKARVRHMVRLAESLGEKLGASKYADSFIAVEDKRLIDLCGFRDAARARARFLFARVASIQILPILFCFIASGRSYAGHRVLSYLIAVFFGAALGYMLPKWILQRRAKKRRLAAAQELPLFIDLLRLLQGVGLSIDQCLQVLVSEFSVVMPVLAFELRLATDLHARGRSREQSLQRLSTGFDNDDLAAISGLIIQVDRHGGAMQEPLARFGERVRERRKLELKEKVAKLTVKMTGVMVLTLLPGLLIITGGPGFLAIFRGLSRAGGG